jgi:hypothetical protein
LGTINRFSGRADSDFRGFINQLELIFELAPTRYSTDRIKISYLGTLLEGPALRWFNPIMEQPEKFEPHLKTWLTFKTYMRATFGQVDPTRAANQALRKLRQGRNTVLEYATTFRQLAVESDWAESTKRDGFTMGLHNEIQDRLLNHAEQETLEDLIHLTIRIEERMNNQAFLRNRPGLFHAPFHRPTPQSRGDTSVGPTPMDLDAVQRRGPLTAAERQRRIDERLCLVCGKEGHYRVNCPERRVKKDF